MVGVSVCCRLGSSFSEAVLVTRGSTSVSRTFIRHNDVIGILTVEESFSLLDLTEFAESSQCGQSGSVAEGRGANKMSTLDKNPLHGSPRGV